MMYNPPNWRQWTWKCEERATKWLKENNYSATIKKWETKKWGEIPADFGRK